jgi:hypothetical protein
MKITKLTYRRGVTINTGDFESVRIDAGMDADLEEGEDPVVCYQELKKLVRAQMRPEVEKIRQQLEGNQ